MSLCSNIYPLFSLNAFLRILLWDVYEVLLGALKAILRLREIDLSQLHIIQANGS